MRLNVDSLTVLLQEEVVSLSTQLQQLRDQFGQKTTEQLDLKAKADLMERRLTAASKLIVGLSSERTRWTADMQVCLLHSSCCNATLPLDTPILCCPIHLSCLSFLLMLPLES